MRYCKACICNHEDNETCPEEQYYLDRPLEEDPDPGKGLYTFKDQTKELKDYRSEQQERNSRRFETLQ